MKTPSGQPPWRGDSAAWRLASRFSEGILNKAVRAPLLAGTIPAEHP